ncbi:TPA: MFS transporter [Photobacterium damselae]
MRDTNYANFAVTMGAVSSGALLVLGPFFSAVSDSDYWLPYYFLVYILTNIVVNKYLTKVIDRKGGKHYLGWSFKLRILIITGTIPLVLTDSGLMVVTFLSLGAALPDALFRSAYPTYVKKMYKDEELQKINSNYSVFRQVGYVLGTGLSGLLITYSITSVLGVLVVLSIMSLIALNKIDPDKVIDNAPTDSGHNVKGFLSFLVGERLLMLYLSILMMLVVGFVLPMSLAPFVVDHLKKSSVELGVLEAAFSCGAFIGAYFYGKKIGDWVAPVMLVFASALLVSVYWVAFEVLIPLFVFIGIVLQCSIWFFTQLQIATSGDRIGEVITNLYFHATLLSAMYMIVVTIFPDKIIDNSYYLVAMALMASFLAYLIQLKTNKTSQESANEVQ